ncbi:unnamed protein product [Effrenium voratum]|nr:unnamed protein product [Effrenium voratum]CAJ1440063.1 unnamed protein product [Effrenium voratum]
MPPEKLHARGLCYADTREAFYRCRYCTRWKETREFSPGQIQWVNDSKARREPVCQACAGFAMRLEGPLPLEEGPRSIPVEARYALVLAFCGEYAGLPEFNEDILRCIISFLTVRVAPFISDLGDGYRCVACCRDFQTVEHALQHAETSKRHAQALKEAAAV